MHDEDLLMALLNSAPIVDGERIEGMDGSAGEEFVRLFGGTGSPAELLALRAARDALHDIIRGHGDGGSRLGQLFGNAVLQPSVSAEGIRWSLQAPPTERLAARATLAWSKVMEEMPGRLRACANTECNLFLIDHSRPGTAKWCSMATCGNRIKARAHARRARGS